MKYITCASITKEKPLLNRDYINKVAAAPFTYWIQDKSIINICSNVPHGRAAHTGEPRTFAKTTPKSTLLWPVTAYFSPV
jgi:hypothetical protein